MMQTIRERRMAKRRKKQQAYLTKYEAKIYKGNKNVPSYAQYLQEEYNKSSATKQIDSRASQAGDVTKELNRMRGKKK